jgi:uncharacterized membrane protein
MLAIPAITFFLVVLAVHIAAVVISFGVTFAYPFMAVYIRRAEPRSVPVLHRLQAHLDRRWVSPGMIVVLAAGIYLASKLHSFSDFYVQWGFGAIVVLGGLAGAYFAPRDTRLAELAQRDIDAAGDGEPTFSAEYESLNRQVAIVGTATGLLILLTIYFMVAQTGA